MFPLMCYVRIMCSSKIQMIEDTTLIHSYLPHLFKRPPMILDGSSGDSRARTMHVFYLGNSQSVLPLQVF